MPGRFTYMTVTDMRTVSQRLAPALAHLFNHQTHHRGQAHMILTVLGKPSVPLDLIYSSGPRKAGRLPERPASCMADGGALLRRLGVTAGMTTPRPARSGS